MVRLLRSTGWSRSKALHLTFLSSTDHSEAMGCSRVMLRRGLQSLNLARRRFGLPLLSDPVAQLRAADRLFIASSKHFDFVLEPDPWITYLGPQFYTVGSHWRGTAVRSNGLPYIVVAFSTAFQNHLAVLGRIAQALGKLPVHA